MKALLPFRVLLIALVVTTSFSRAEKTNEKNEPSPDAIVDGSARSVELLLEKARTAIDEGNFYSAMNVLQTILEKPPIILHGGAQASYEAARHILFQIPRKEWKRYEEIYGIPARQKLEAATKNGKIDGLVEVAYRYPLSQAAEEARNILARHAWQNAKPITSLYFLNELSRLKGGIEKVEEPLLALGAISAVAAGSPKESSKWVDELRGRAKYQKGELILGGQNISPEQFDRMLARVNSLSPEKRTKDFRSMVDHLVKLARGLPETKVDLSASRPVRCFNSKDGLSRGVSYALDENLRVSLIDGKNILRQWDLWMGEPISQPVDLKSYPADTNFHIINDGKWLVALRGNQLQFWDLHPHRPLFEIDSPTIGPRAIESLAISPDGKRAAYRTFSTIEIWNLEKREPMVSISAKGVEKMSFSEDGNTLFATPQIEKPLPLSFRVFQLPTGTDVSPDLIVGKDQSPYAALDFSAGGKLALVQKIKNSDFVEEPLPPTYLVLDRSSLKSHGKPFTPIRSRLQWLPDGKRILILPEPKSGYQPLLQVFDPRTGLVVGSILLPDKTPITDPFAVSPDGNFIALHNSEGSGICVWRLEYDQEKPLEIPEKIKVIEQLQVPNGAVQQADPVIHDPSMP